MFRYYIIFIFLLFSLHSKVKGQTTFIPDTNFRKFLKITFPNILDNKGLLIDSIAKKQTTINCSNYNITSLSGIEKFRNLVTLDCSHNKLSNIDSIGKISSLTNLFCNNNSINRLPELTYLKNINRFYVNNNNLTSVLDLSNNVALVDFNCKFNNLTQINGLNNLINLQFFTCNNNSLIQLGGLGGLKNLLRLLCFENKLINLNGLPELSKLTTLEANNNQIKELPQFSTLTSIKDLLFSNNKITVIPSLSNCKLLEKIDFSYNAILKIPDFQNNINLTDLIFENCQLDTVSDLSFLKNIKTADFSKNNLRSANAINFNANTLGIFQLDSNILTNLPDFTAFNKLGILYVRNNFLDFADLEPVLNLKNLSDYSYAPQNSIDKDFVTFRTLGSQISIISGDSSITGNIYKWFKNGAIQKNLTTNKFLIDPIELSDSGTYSCTITNPRLQSLSLTKKVINLKVYACQPSTPVEYQVSKYDCYAGAQIIVDTTNIKLGIAPYQYVLESKKSNIALNSKKNVFNNIYENAYTLTISDSYGCSYSKEITFENNKPSDCDITVINPDNDQDPNHIFIKETGNANVFDKSGRLIYSFQVPGNWDGRNNNGNILPGFYIVQVNDKQFPVTVIK